MTFVDKLTQAGIEPLFVLYGSPSWANGVAASVPDQKLYVPTDPADFENWLAEYESFVRAAVDRYRGRVRFWEVWNEENERFFWKPAPDVAQYCPLLRPDSGRDSTRGPLGRGGRRGLAGLNASIEIPGVTFLAEIVSRGIAFDRVAIHPYAVQGPAPDVHIPWEGNFDDVALVHDRLAALGRDVPIWVTEWGWSTNRVSDKTKRATSRIA